jgi:glutathione S-transferase
MEPVFARSATTVMTQSNLTLFHSLTSVCSQKVRLTLAELELEFESRVMDLKQGDQFAPDYLVLNPNGVVPTLLDGRHVVLHSNDIMQHLCRSKPDHPFSQATAGASEHCALWFERADRFHLAIHAITYVSVNRERLMALSPEQLEQRFRNIPDVDRSKRLREIVDKGFRSVPVQTATETTTELLSYLQSTTHRQRWLAGDRLSLADLAMFPFVHRLHLLGFDALWKDSNLARWHQEIMQRPAFNIAISRLVPDAANRNFARAGQIAWPHLFGQPT